MSKKDNAFEYDGKQYYVEHPTPTVHAEADKMYNTTMIKIINSPDGCLLKAGMDDFLKENRVWDPEKEQQISEIVIQMDEYTETLEKGGISLKQAKQVALDLRMVRMQYYSLIAYKNQYYSLTAESHADNAKFNYLVSQCLMNDDGTKVYKSYKDYSNQAIGELPELAAEELSKIIYGISSDFIKDNPENKFLVEYGFENEDYQPLDADGNIVESDESESSFSPFLNDDGEPVELQQN